MGQGFSDLRHLFCASRLGLIRILRANQFHMNTSDKQYPRVPTETCYLYILAKGEMQYTIGIVGNPEMWEGNLKKERKSHGDDGPMERLVYCRPFPDTLSALGFKMLLERLVPSSVDFIIRRSNPGLETLAFQRAQSNA
jgi:hypothetical protein